MRDLQEAANLIVGPPARSLRDVCPHGSGRATQLTRQSIRLLPWKLTSRIVDVQSHLVSFLPYNQFFVVLHSSCSSLKAHCSSLVAHCSLLKSFSQNSSPAFAALCRSTPAQTARRKFPRRTFRFPTFRRFRRCAWTRQLSAGSGFAFREEGALRPGIEMRICHPGIQARRAE